MNAKEMFKELGYERPENRFFSERNGHVVSYKKEWNKHGEDEFTLLVFKNKDKNFQIRSGYIQRDKNNDLLFSPCNIPFKLYQAITQQMKELGWLDD